MRIQCAELAVYNARAVDLLKRWQEHRVPGSDVDAIAGPQPDSMAALLGYEPEAIPLGLEDPPLVVEGGLDECREHRSISGIHDFSFNPGLGFWAFVVSRTGQIGTFAKQTLVSAPTRWLAGGSARLCGLLRQSIHLVLH